MGLDPSLARFVSKVKRQPNGCHTYGKRSLDNYVVVNLYGGQFRAHRVAWMIKNGPIPDEFVVHHKCHNPGCVNADHLEAKTQSDHISDHAQERLPGHLANKLRGLIDPAA